MIDLNYFEYQWFSQHNEDGVIEEILFQIGCNSQSYVEFGAADGLLHSNTRWLREEHGFTGLLLDKNYHNKSLNLHKEWITAENINPLFSKYNVPRDFDVLSIDVDYNDLYLWKALDSRYCPRLVIIEYNAFHPPSEDKIVIYNPYAQWDYTNYHGASLLALYKLGRSKGYSLIYVESSGSNAFFIRDDLLKKTSSSFIFMNDVEKLYRKPGYGIFHQGHRQDPLKRPLISWNSLCGI